MYLQLAERGNDKTRAYAFDRLAPRDDHTDQAAILSVLRRHLTDDDPSWRLYVARGVWRTTKDRKVTEVVVAFKDHPYREMLYPVVDLLVQLAEGEPAFLEPLAPADAFTCCFFIFPPRFTCE